ncbi:MAG: DUF2949 domain-containing protein [Thermosynechococcaceae cyanobacterium]
MLTVIFSGIDNWAAKYTGGKALERSFKSKSSVFSPSSIGFAVAIVVDRPVFLLCSCFGETIVPLPLALFMSVSLQQRFIEYLKTELAIPEASIAVVLRRAGYHPGQLHMMLWQYGLITLQQLEKIFDWLEATPAL